MTKISLEGFLLEEKYAHIKSENYHIITNQVLGRGTSSAPTDSPKSVSIAHTLLQ